MWISRRSKGDNNMKKKEFEMENEKITEYTSSNENAVKDIPCVDAKKYMESQDTTIGFYSDSELEVGKDGLIYNFSEGAKFFVENTLKIYRYKRHYLIKQIADIFEKNSVYGLTTTYKWIIPDISDKICKEYQISIEAFYMLTKVILLEISDKFNRIDRWHHHSIMTYPDSLFYSWTTHINKDTYNFYNVQKCSDNPDDSSFKIRYTGFNFDTKTHYSLGVPMYIGLYNRESICKNVDFGFETTDISKVIDNLDAINKLKGEE